MPFVYHIYTIIINYSITGWTIDLMVLYYIYTDVSENSGTPKSSILIGFSTIFTIHFGVPLFLETPIYNHNMFYTIFWCFNEMDKVGTFEGYRKMNVRTCNIPTMCIRMSYLGHTAKYLGKHYWGTLPGVPTCSRWFKHDASNDANEQWVTRTLVVLGDYMNSTQLYGYFK